MMQADSPLIGVDGGGTSCRVALVRSGQSRQEVTGGPANVTSDFDGAIATILDLIGNLLRDGDGAMMHIHLGLAGVTGTGMANRVQVAILERHPGALVRATGDQVTMAAGALGAADGAVAGIGTGSFVARQSSGQVSSVGGRGLVLGDQASGGWLGLRLLQEVMLIHDGLRGPTGLGDEILSDHGHDPARVIGFARDARPVDFAALAPRIIAAAQQGDRLAQDLLNEGADYIARALGILGWRADEPLCLAGGLGPAYAPYLAPALQACLRPAQGNALDGALYLAGTLAKAAGRAA